MPTIIRNGEEIDVTNEELAAMHEPPSFEAKREIKRSAVNALRESKLAGGFAHDFGAPYGEHVLQTRGADDRVNWLTSHAAYAAAIAGGQGATIGAAFRTASNATIVVSYADGLGVLLSMAAWGAAILSRSWQLKDSINAAADEAALDAIDVGAGWPS